MEISIQWLVKKEQFSTFSDQSNTRDIPIPTTPDVSIIEYLNRPQIKQTIYKKYSLISDKQRLPSHTMNNFVLWTVICTCELNRVNCLVPQIKVATLRLHCQASQFWLWRCLKKMASTWNTTLPKLLVQFGRAQLRHCSQDCKPAPKTVELETAEDVRKRIVQNCKIVIRGQENCSLINGRPVEITCTRTVRIYQPPKNAQQQGTMNLGHWLIDFDTKERWENPLMGWCSSGDPMSNLKLRFSTKEEAITFCHGNNLSYWVQQSKTRKKFKVKSYALNYHYQKRSRVSTKWKCT